MLLTLTLTQAPATDLGFLLGKNPARAQSFPLSFGQAHVSYPEASAARCTVGVPRHPDHPFEWTRAEFRAWADRVAEGFGYRVTYRGVGVEHAEVGPPTQMGVFVRRARPPS